MATRKGSVDGVIQGAADPSMTVLSLLTEMREVRERDSEWYRAAELRERIVLGEPILPTDPAVRVQATSPDNVGTGMHENAILPTIETLVARVDQGRIDSKAWPHTPTPARIAAAEAANLVLDSERARQRRDMKAHESLLWALIHGESGLYATWDDGYGPIEAYEPVIDPNDGYVAVDPAGAYPPMQPVQEWGGLRLEVLSTFDFWTSGEDNAEDLRWVVRRRIVDKWTAKKRFVEMGIGRDPSEKAFALNGAAGRYKRARKGVEVFEIWVKPGAMIEGGLFALVIDEVVVQNEPWPLPHKKLPITVLSCMRVYGSPHGHTPTEDGIDQQRLINTSLRSILRRADVAGNVRLIGADEVVEQMDDDPDGLVRYNGTKDVDGAAMYMAAPDIPQGLVGVYQLASNALNTVMGVSKDSVSGGDASSTSSGEQLKTAAALDSQKTVALRRRAEEAWTEVDRQTVELFRAKVSKPRLISVTGDPVRAMFLQGADLNGVDVSLESASGLEQSHLGRARTAEEGAAAGFVSPQDASEMRTTGLAQTMLDAETQTRVEQQGTQALRGNAQTPMPGIPSQAAARVLRAMLARAPAGRTAMLLQLIAAYEAAPPPMQPGEGAAPGPPGMPKPSLTQSTQLAAQNVPPGAIQ